MADGTVTIDILMNDGSVVKGTTNLKQAFNGLKGEAEGAGGGIKKAFTFGAAFSLAQQGISAIGNGVKTFAKASIGAAADFEQTMNLVQANSNASSKEMDKLNQLAKQLGADTKFSAGEAAGAILELTKAGITPAQVEAGALKATMDLAAASGMDLGDAANVTANALNTFHMNASESVRVADALAGAANASSADVSDLAQGLAQVGPVAAQMGLDINDTAGALAMFAQNGMKGSDAGTSLKTMLMNLQPTSKNQIILFEQLGLSSKDLVTEQNKLGNAFINSDGSFKSFSEISGVLNEKLKGLSAAQKAQALETIFGSDAVRAATIATTEGAKGFDKYRKATEEQGAAQKMSDAYMKGFKGTLEQLQGALETLGLSIGERVLPFLTQLMSNTSEVVDYITNNLSSIFSFAKSFSMVAASVIAGIAAYKTYVGVVAAVNAIMGIKNTIFAISNGLALAQFVRTNALTAAEAANAAATMGASGAFALFNAVLSMNPIGLVIGALVALTAGLVFFFTQTETGKKVWRDLSTTLMSVASKILPTLSNAWSSVVKAMQPFISMISGGISSAISLFVSLFNQAKGSISGFKVDAMSIVSVITTIGTVLLGVTGPIGIAIGLLAKFAVAFAQTGDASKAIQMVADNITGMIDTVSSVLPKIITTVASVIAKVLPQMIKLGTDLIVKLIEGLTQAIPQITNVISTIIPQIVTAITGVIPQLVTVAVNIIQALITGLTTALPLVIAAGVSILPTLIQGIIQVLPLLLNAALQIITTLINAIIPLIPVLISAGVQILMALIQGIISILPALIQAALTIIVALVNGLIQALPQLLTAAAQLISALVVAIVQLAPQLLAAGVTIFGALIRGIGSLLGQLLAMGVNLLSQLIGTIGGFAGQMLAKGVQLITSIISGIGSMIGTAVAKIASLGTQIVGKIGSFVGQMLSKGAQLISNVANGIGNGIGGAVGKVADLGRQLVDKVSGFAGEMLSAGGNLIAGFADGIANGASRAVEAAANAAKGAVDKVKSMLGIHSPSRVFRDEVGKFIPAGIAVGIDANTSEITRSLTDMQKEMLSTMNPESSLNIGNARGLRQAGQVIANTFTPQIVPSSSTSTTFETTIIAPEKPSEREYVRLQKNAWRDMARQIP